MIGAVQPDESGELLFRQWFSERPSEEADLLNSFFAALPEHCRLLHFNGTTFDIPYLRDRSRILGLPAMPAYLSLDLYTSLRRLKTLAGLASCRQRDLEPLAGYDREDPYDGGTLIRFYTEYVGLSKFNPSAAEERYSDLARHNREDLLGLVTLCKLMPCLDIAESGIQSVSVAEQNNTSVTLRLAMSVAWPLQLRIHRPISRFLSTATDSGAELTLSSDADGGLLLQIPLLTEPAKHYYPNYKDYFYLPMENRVVHRSIASHVDRAFRRPAKREEAFALSKGALLPQAGELFHPSFYYRAKDLCGVFPVAELNRHPELLPEYASQILSLFGRSR